VSPSRSRRTKWLLLALKLLIVALVVWFVRGTLLKAWQQIGEHRWSLDPAWLGAAGGLYLLGLLPAGLFWCRVLRVLGQEAGLGETLRAYFIGHLGKYVPGKAMVVVLRAGLVRSHRVDTTVAAASVFFETLTMMAVGACLAAGILAVRLREERLMFWVAIGLMAVAGLPTVPPVFKSLAGLSTRLAGKGQPHPATQAGLAKLGYGTLALGWACMGLSWVILGLSLWATLRAMGIDQFGPWAHLSSYTASVALAMVAGFLSLIPGGLGVRDLILVQLIERLCEVGAAEAAVAAALLRLVWLVAELLISGILYVSVPRAVAAVRPEKAPPGP
jgi:uncharacterized membrane protein YbhN (UPF0104 family)